jgi:hypothetical protein
MTRALVLLCTSLVLACQPKSNTNPPDAKGHTEGVTNEQVIPSSDPTGAECVARCLETDAHKDLAVDEREAACKADCPAPESTPEGEAAPAQ